MCLVPGGYNLGERFLSVHLEDHVGLHVKYSTVWHIDPPKLIILHILLMEEILHHLKSLKSQE